MLYVKHLLLFCCLVTICYVGLQLLEYFKPSKPWVRTTSVKKRQQEGPLKERPLKYLNAELERVLFREFLNNRFKPRYSLHEYLIPLNLESK